MSSGFVSSSELDEERRKKQEEWDRVRKPDDPLVVPEAEVCNKSLFEQLRDNKEVKDAEKDEAKKFKNMIRGIDEDESDFLAQVDKMKSNHDKQKRMEEEKLLKEVAQARIRLVETSAGTSLSTLATVSVAAKPPPSRQAALISTLIKRKSDGNGSEPPEKISRKGDHTHEEPMLSSPAASAVKVVGSIPGIIAYDRSSDSASSDSSEEETEIVSVLQVSRPERKSDCQGANQ